MTTIDAAIEDLARAIARGQGHNFDTLYAGPKAQIMRDAKSAYHHLTDRQAAAEPKPMSHGYTAHGHRCCEFLAGHQPGMPTWPIAKCGGPGICAECTTIVQRWHDPDAAPTAS